MLYIIYEDNFLSDYILRPLRERNDIRLIPFERIRYHNYKRPLWLAMRFIRASIIDKKGFLTGWYFPERFIGRIREIGKKDKVLLFSIQNLKELMVLDKELESTDKNVFIWNPLCVINRNKRSRSKYARKMHDAGMKVYTFDEGDAKNYGFGLLNQIYRSPRPGELEETECDNNRCVFFVGTDKQRSGKLARLSESFEIAGIKCDFHILRDKKTCEEATLQKYYSSRLVEYPEYLRRLRQSACMLEILQEGQSGMTVRTLEALFFGKKFITNNQGARDFPFYHPDNIFILDGDSTDGLAEFMARPLHPIAEEIIAPYRLENWIKKFEQ